ncbi:hypothetical protein P872_04650 [Rhodonellum psychrophilum GCM71 = DSM 17998]|uniref:DNA topoisomerase IV subunit B n=2 Tax=Rhodonellum TaxID=336827 RepID=U5C337_9BACT|nr:MULTISPECIES: hypothetical protein [Rhodonellum]ERM82607.1 hypothetical protein P872_04650 [Rhodonellum psychrophilum GCM71 = DSM 17998]MDO9553914.1 DNA topoisomerase IV [Rhodonellum sp.]SDZ53540.1 hypothetical protein SAMN05444412_12142 [Rhodonellum ikkaensis]
MHFRFGKVFHFFSVLLFIFSFLFIYASLSEQVAYAIDDQGTVLKQVSKESFFYTGIIFFVVLNVLIIFPGKMVENQSTKNIKRLFPVGDPARDRMLIWIYSFAGIINVCLAIMLLFIKSLNHQNEISMSEFSFFFYLIPVFFVVWIIALFWILLEKFKSVQVK